MKIFQILTAHQGIIPDALLSVALALIAVSVFAFLFFQRRRLFNAHRWNLFFVGMFFVSGSINMFFRAMPKYYNMERITDWGFVVFTYTLLAYLMYFYADQWRKPTKKEFLITGDKIRQKYDETEAKAGRM